MSKKYFLSMATVLTVGLLFLAKPTLATEPNLIGADWNLEQVGITAWRNYGTPRLKEKTFSTDTQSQVLHVIGSRLGSSGVQMINIPVIAGGTYELTFDYKATTNSKIQPLLGIHSSNRDLNNITTRYPAGSTNYNVWKSYSRTITIPATATGLNDFRVVLILTKNSEVYFDNIILKRLLPEVIPTPIPAMETWWSNIDEDYGINSVTGLNEPTEDHGDAGIDVYDFTRACQLPPELWSKARFSDNQALVDQMNDIARRLNTTWNNYQKMCVENDPDGDWLFTEGAYDYEANNTFWGCSYNDPSPNTPDTVNNCSYGFVKKPYTTITPAPQPDPIIPAPTPNPAPIPTPGFPTNDPTVPVETYINQQNINFEAFPRLTINSFTGRTIEIYPGANTLENAVNTAQANDKIILHAGTYTVTNFLSITKPLYIGGAGNEAVIINIPAGDNRRGIEITGEGVMLEKFKLNIARTNGIALYVSKNIVIRNINLTMTEAGYSEGIVAYASNNGLLLENVTIENTIMGVSCNSAACTNWKLSNVKIANKTSADGSGADCFANESGQNLFLKNVEVTGCTADGIDIKGSNVLLVNPWVHNVGRNGIKLWNGGDIINALVVDTGADVSIYLGDRGYSRLINSTIALPSHNGRAYVLASGYNESASDMKIEIINSIVYQNGTNTGAVLYMPNINNTNRTLKIQNSLFYISSGAVEIEANTNRYFTDIANNNRLNVNPLFVNPTITGDFQLTTNSPALNHGQDTAYAFDRTGKTRSAGLFDMGVYER